MKKLVSIVLALCMVLMMGAAFAAETSDLTVDTTISISGLTQGDTVNLYKVLEWVDGQGWKATSEFLSLADSALKNFIENKTDAANNFSAEDLVAIATAAQGKTAINSDKAVPAGGTFTYTVKPTEATAATAGAGMYLALVKAVTPGTVYNPIIVSADFAQKDTNETSTIDASTATIVGTAIAKKEPVTLLKTEPKITNDIGDTYNYTINTTIPAYSEAFTDTFFKVTDKLSSYLDIVESSIIINGVTGGTTAVDTDKHGFTITLKNVSVNASE